MQSQSQGTFSRMIVVADTSPLNYLIQISCDGLLPRLFGKIRAE